MQTVTNKDGYYTLSHLNPSTYDIEVEAARFSRARRAGLERMVADKRDISIGLSIGKLSAQVTVTAEANEIQTADASRGLNFLRQP